MIASLLLALLVTFSGTVATYLYDENASLGARLCAGAAIGLAALGLIGFVWAPPGVVRLGIVRETCPPLGDLQ